MEPGERMNLVAGCGHRLFYKAADKSGFAENRYS